MNGMMLENRSTVVEKYESIQPLIHTIDSIIDDCYRVCHKKFLIHLSIDV